MTTPTPGGKERGVEVKAMTRTEIAAIRDALDGRNDEWRDGTVLRLIAAYDLLAGECRAWRATGIRRTEQGYWIPALPLDTLGTIDAARARTDAAGGVGA